jgi:hypothetical protein
MDEDQIKIEYQRDGTTYSGVISRPTPEPDATQEVLYFTGWEFRQIVRELHLWMVRRPSASMVWIRRDVPPHAPYRLEDWLVRMIHVDPVAAIRAMSPAPVTINIRDIAKQHDKGGVLQVAHDVIADAFGDWVYIEVGPDTRVATCVCCGRSATLSSRDVTQNPFINCGRCGMKMWLEQTDDPHWTRVKTESLLQYGWDRYCIPRRWNPNGQWISTAELAAMYETFKKEREACSQEKV